MVAMERQLRQALQTLYELAQRYPQQDIDEYHLARQLELIPATMLAHHYLKSPQRGKFLRLLTALEERKFIYVTQNGFWRLHLTANGRHWLAQRQPAAPAEAGDQTPVYQAIALPSCSTEWQAPRPAPAPERHDRVTTIALGVVTLAAVLTIAFGILPEGPLAGHAAAKPEAASLMLTTVPTLPPPPPTSTPPPTPTAPPPHRLIVANTGGIGVVLRSAPQTGARLAALADDTVLIELGPPTTAGGETWLHVRTPDGAEGYVAARYTVDAP